MSTSLPSSSLSQDGSQAAQAAQVATPEALASAPPARRRRRWWGRLAAMLGLGGLWTMIHSTGYFSALGGTPEGERLARMQGSAQFQGGRFINPSLREQVDLLSASGPVEGQQHVFWRWLLGKEQRTPDRDLPVVARTAASFGALPASGLQVTWLGHSTLIIEIDGHRMLAGSHQILMVEVGGLQSIEQGGPGTLPFMKSLDFLQGFAGSRGDVLHPSIGAMVEDGRATERRRGTLLI